METMFLGEFTHSLDIKGRMFLPARFREALARAFVARQADGCLAVWAPEEFEVRAREIRDLGKTDEVNRNRARAFFSGAEEVVPDKQGRIAIPQHLRDFAHLRGEVVVAGLFDHLELWEPQRWLETRRAGEVSLASG